MSAIAAVLAAAGQFVPGLGLVVGFAWPVPLVVVVVRHGLRTGLLSVVTTAGVIAAFLGPVQALVTMVASGGLALALGHGIRRGYRAERTVALGAIANALAFPFLVRIYLWWTGRDVIRDSAELLAESLRRTVALYEGLAGQLEERFGPAFAAALRQQLEVMRELAAVLPGELPRLLGIAVVAAGFMAAGITYPIAAAVLRRVGHPVPAATAFVRWQLPRWTLALYPVAALLLVAPRWLGETGPGALAWTLGVNAWFAAHVLFLVQGLAVGWFFLDRWRMGKGWKLAVTVFAVSSPLLSQLLPFLGLFDVAMDVRGLGRPAPDPGPPGGPPAGGRAPAEGGPRTPTEGGFGGVARSRKEGRP